MLDLVLKSKDGPVTQKGEPALLPPRQYQIASFLKGKGLVGSGEISRNLGIASGPVISILSCMVEKNTVLKREGMKGRKAAHLYALASSEFTLKTTGRGVKKCLLN